MAYPIVRTDNMSGTTDSALLRSVKYGSFSGSTFTAAGINNGCVAKLDKILDATKDREVWAAVVPAANTPLQDIVLIATPELDPDPRNRNLDTFTNAAGSIQRGYHFHQNDVFSVTSDAFSGYVSGTTAVGYAVELQADNKMKIVASATASTTQIGKIIQIETVGSKTYIVIRVC